MTEEHVVRDDEVDLNQKASWAGILAVENERIALLCKNHRMELNNIIDYILHPHTHEEITIYAMALKHRLEEK